METSRQQKVNRLLQKDLGEIFQIDMMGAFPNTMITVTSVRITSDLSLARINLSVFATKDKEAVLKSIKAKSGEIRLHLGKRVKNQLRIVPQLQFFIDNSLDYIERIEELLKS